MILENNDTDHTLRMNAKHTIRNHLHISHINTHIDLFHTDIVPLFYIISSAVLRGFKTMVQYQYQTDQYVYSFHT